MQTDQAQHHIPAPPALKELGASFPHAIRHSGIHLANQLNCIAKAMALVSRLTVLKELGAETVVSVAPGNAGKIAANHPPSFALSDILFDDQPLSRWVDRQNKQYEVFKDNLKHSKPWEEEFDALLTTADNLWQSSGLMGNVITAFQSLTAAQPTVDGLTLLTLDQYHTFKAAAVLSLEHAINIQADTLGAFSSEYHNTKRVLGIMQAYRDAVMDITQPEDTIMIYTSKPLQHLLDPK